MAVALVIGASHTASRKAQSTEHVFSHRHRAHETSRFKTGKVAVQLASTNTPVAIALQVQACVCNAAAQQHAASAMLQRYLGPNSPIPCM